MFRLASLVVVVSLCGAVAAEAQHFGRNKVQYESFAFRILETDHFDVYYYPSERSAAEIAARLAERWYARLSKSLAHDFRDRQPLILYGSYPDFAQTNVVSNHLREDIGGVTESHRRRIILPFTGGLREFDHVLGHELVHAFQFDIAEAIGRGSVRMPLWLAEGMAEYLSLGSADAFTTMWIRDAIERDELPTLEDLVRRRVSPYRYGHAFWAYLGGRFGDGVLGAVLRAKPTSDVVARIVRVTGIDAATLSREWQTAMRSAVAMPLVSDPSPARPLVTARQTGSRLHVAPSLSPDGRQIAFLSDNDRFSVDLFFADAQTGDVQHRVASTATDPHFDSLQFIRSAGDWHPSGQRFVIAAVHQGDPVLTVFDAATRRKQTEIAFPEFGQIFNPAWSPDGRRLAFSGLKGGFSDLYLYDLDTRGLHQIMSDAYADLQPAWSPDGTQLAFATDRFTSELSDLAFGTYQLATVDVASGTLEQVWEATEADCFDPHWSRDGSSLFFVSTRGGVSDVFRVDLASETTHRITTATSGVTGITAVSPTLSAARDIDKLVFSVYRNGGYDLYAIDSAGELKGRQETEVLTRVAERQPVAPTEPGPVDQVLSSAATSQERRSAFADREYRSELNFNGFGQPYFSSGGGSFGTFVRGGISFSFDDMLRDRLMSVGIQAGTRWRDFAGRAQYLDRRSRWNWGVLVEQAPLLGSRARQHRADTVADGRVTVTTDRLFQVHRELTGMLAYPLNRSERIEFRGGVSTITFERDVRSRTYSRTTRRLLAEEHQTMNGGDPVTLGLAAVALVHDTSILGAAGPIFGQRYRLELAPAVGDVSFFRVLADYRRYLMPLHPFTVALRVLHVGRYGADADDARLEPYFVGYPGLVRGYRTSALREIACGSEAAARCDALDAYVGNKLAVGNLELRFPLLGLRSRTFTYGRFPIEGLVFTDAGIAWGGDDGALASRLGGRLVHSVGAGIRVNAAGMIAEVSAARPIGAHDGRWRFSANFGPAF